jgi:hypothetical protein
MHTYERQAHRQAGRRACEGQSVPEAAVRARGSGKHGQASRQA